MQQSSALTGFYRLSVEERLALVCDWADITREEKALLQQFGSLSMDQADRMIENVIGVFPIPLSIAVNFTVNGQDVLVPMVTEEPSVVAAASNAAKQARPKGGFKATYTGSLMRGQIQLLDVVDPHAAALRLYEHKEELLALCNEKDPTLVALGGGAVDIETFVLDTVEGPMLIAHLIVDTRDAMGANAVNTMAEAIAPTMASIVQGRALLRIISNLADRRLVRVRAVFDRDVVGGEEVVRNIISAYQFADADPYRAATHNKGVMNGITAVVLATGNDIRAIEAGAHAYAARSGRYRSLSRWERDPNGDLIGSLELPMAVGIVGGATKSHPIARLALKLMKVTSAAELACVIGSVGLAQNFGALKALATEGIQRGHMSLHARNLAIMAGAPIDLVDRVVERAVRAKDVRYDRIAQIVEELKKGE